MRVKVRSTSVDTLRRSLALALVIASCSCGKGTSGGGTTPATSSQAGVTSTTPDTDAAVAWDDRTRDLWTRAKDGDEDDLMRLAAREGSAGLEEGARDSAWKNTAIRAMAYAPGLAQIAYLADVAKGGADEDARAALVSLATIAARVRTSEDPEDALELRAGCDTLKSLADDSSAPRERRIGAVRALRMLADRGCVRSADIHDVR
jgi:hypothetical protein